MGVLFMRMEEFREILVLCYHYVSRLSGTLASTGINQSMITD